MEVTTKHNKLKGNGNGPEMRADSTCSMSDGSAERQKRESAKLGLRSSSKGPKMERLSNHSAKGSKMERLSTHSRATSTTSSMTTAGSEKGLRRVSGHTSVAAVSRHGLRRNKSDATEKMKKSSFSTNPSPSEPGQGKGMPSSAKSAGRGLHKHIHARRLLVGHVTDSNIITTKEVEETNIIKVPEGEKAILADIRTLPYTHAQQQQLTEPQAGAYPVDFVPRDAYGFEHDDDLEQYREGGAGELVVAEQNIDLSVPSEEDPEIGGLVEATAVGSFNFIPLQEAQQVDETHLKQMAHQKYKEKACRRTGFIIVGISLIILAVGLGFGLSERKKRSDKNKVIPPTITANTEIPSTVPSSPPTAMDPLVDLMQNLPAHSLESIEIYGTPQQKAFDWLSRHKNLTNLPTWRKVQLFALATLYWSFEGPHWLGGIPLDWLEEDKNECDWFSGEYGTLCDEQGYKEGARHGVDSCNEHGEFLALSLVCMRMENLAPTMPREIALLTSLEIIELAENRIPGNLKTMLPSELFRMESLIKLYIEGNSLTGTLPTQIGLFPSLWKLDIFNNQLTGTIPTEVGMISTLVRLELSNNTMTGTIPTELGLPVTPHTIFLRDNHFTGTIPTELGMLSTAEWLHLHNNSLTGPIPTELGNMPWLRELSLKHNELTGPVPTELGSLSFLEVLDLSNLPTLTGSIPSEFSELANLRVMHLQASPGLNGSIPEGFCYLQQSDNSSSCIYDSLSSWHNDSFRINNNCSLQFDCSPFLCGCDCDCNL